ncbi:alpha/beta hydrolase [Pontibacter sp. G13]|uniref:alpha/beta hydrolase n=1 Tax=Pontibacter sp. G13 TaxID=3074898 RepID=UPI00288A2FB6|nr:alpha/beta hydrolase [Pontibacter sp. G13]WNJ17137.1 alpha/beta hydrolase [Pontibacter sp. G13]
MCITHSPRVWGVQLVAAVFDPKICDVWGVKNVSKIENMAIQSDVPVLLISGEYDELTPVKWAESRTDNLTNSYHLIFKGWKHGPTTNWSNPCAMQAANDFFNNPTETPKPACFEQIGRPVFKTA